MLFTRACVAFLKRAFWNVFHFHEGSTRANTAKEKGPHNFESDTLQALIAPKACDKAGPVTFNFKPSSLLKTGCFSSSFRYVEENFRPAPGNHSFRIKGQMFMNTLHQVFGCHGLNQHLASSCLHCIRRHLRVT